MNSEAETSDLELAMEIAPGPACSRLESFIRQHTDALEREGVILGLSGGIDSAVVAALCARAVGPDQVLALLMPDKDSSPQGIRDAEELARSLGIETRHIDLTPHIESLGGYQAFALGRLPLGRKLKGLLMRCAFHAYRRLAHETPFTASMVGTKDKDLGSALGASAAFYRLKHRLRMLLLYFHAEKENRLVVGAANKTEAAIGFFVKHGCDHAADVMPLLGLYKTQVSALARHLGLPAAIIDKAPSPDLIPGFDDEDVIGMSYKVLDLILLALERGWTDSDIAESLQVEAEQIQCIKRFTRDSAHMREVYAPGADNAG